MARKSLAYGWSKYVPIQLYKRNPSVFSNKHATKDEYIVSWAISFWENK